MLNSSLRYLHTEYPFLLPLASPDQWREEPDNAFALSLRRWGRADEKRYLRDYPDVRAAGFNACDHFAHHGYLENRRLYDKETGERLFFRPDIQFSRYYSLKHLQSPVHDAKDVVFIADESSCSLVMEALSICIKNSVFPYNFHIIAPDCFEWFRDNLRIPQAPVFDAHIYSCQPILADPTEYLYHLPILLPDSDKALFLPWEAAALNDPQPLFNHLSPYASWRILWGKADAPLRCAILMNLDQMRKEKSSENALTETKKLDGEPPPWLSVSHVPDLVSKGTIDIACPEADFAVKGILSFRDTDKDSTWLARELSSLLPVFPPQDGRIPNKLAMEELSRFLNARVRKNSALVIETMECHGEVMPGVVLSLLKRGMPVDVLLCSDNYAANPLGRIYDDRLNIYHNDAARMSDMLNAERLDKYRLLFFTSKIVYKRDDLPPNPSTYDWHSIFDVYPQLAAVRHKIICYQHHFERFFEDGPDHSVILANPARQPNLELYTANFCEFGQINESGRKNLVTTFLCVGDIKRARRNHALLIDGLSRLLSFTRKFRLIIVARYGDLPIPNILKRHVEFYHNSSFETLYSVAEASDYILPMLDPESPGHERYLQGGTSGSFQLAYGFGKPAIIHTAFASAYHLDSANSIIYADNSDFVSTLRKAADMDPAEYSSLCQGMRKTGAMIRETAEINLDGIFASMKLQNMENI